jgi:hypothetical protein
MGVRRVTTPTLGRWGESVRTEDAAHAKKFGTEGNNDGVVTGRELTVAMLANTPPPSPCG